MGLLQKFLHKINGLHFSQEYLCLAHGSLPNPLKAFLYYDGQIKKDITSQHIFAGYHPLIFVLFSKISDPNSYPDKIEIVFSIRDIALNGFFDQKDAIAVLQLKKIRTQDLNGMILTFYEGEKGKHRFQSFFHQAVNVIHNQLYNRKPGNVFLPNNLYKQVQVAYSIPRKISLITVSNGTHYNLFPTDLHGSAGDALYIISLRHSGKAVKQVEQAKKIVLSEVKPETYKTVYGLGKNHMKEMAPKEGFPFSQQVSANEKLYLPHETLAYRELELQDSFIHDIHKILVFKILSSSGDFDTSPSLVHIHNAYATWRHNKGLAGNYLLR